MSDVGIQPHLASMLAIKDELLASLNAFRSSHGLLPALALNDKLTQAAESHSAWMAQAGVQSHVGRFGSTPATRARSAGYVWRSIGENIAMNMQQSVAAVMDLWAKSPPHRQNMLGLFNDVGLAASTDAQTRRIYWTMLLGVPMPTHIVNQPITDQDVSLSGPIDDVTK